MLDLSLFKLKGKSFVYKLNQFTKPIYTSVCTVCNLAVETKCKIHSNKEKTVICTLCGNLMCWKTWNKSHANGCTIVNEPYFNEVVQCRQGKQRKSSRIDQNPPVPPKRTNITGEYSPAKRPKFNRDYLPSHLFQNVINNRFSQVLPNVGMVKQFAVENVVVFCRYCYLIMNSTSELCHDHSNTAKKYTDINKYICTDCGQIMSYSTFKRHFKNGRCKMVSTDTSKVLPVAPTIEVNTQVISNYPNIHPMLHPCLHLLVSLGEDFLLLLNDLCNTYEKHIVQYCNAIIPMLERFLSILRINTDFNISKISANELLDILNKSDNDSIFEPLSPISHSAASSISVSSVDGDNIIPTTIKLNRIFDPELSIDDSCSSTSITNCIVNDMPIQSQHHLIMDRLTFLVEELMIMSLDFYKVYELFENSVNSIMNDEIGNLNEIKTRIADITLILDNKQSSSYTRVFSTEFDVVDDEEDLFRVLYQKKVKLQNVLVVCDSYKEKSTNYLKLVDFAVGRKIVTANRKMYKLLQDMETMRELKLFQ